MTNDALESMNLLHAESRAWRIWVYPSVRIRADFDDGVTLFSEPFLITPARRVSSEDEKNLPSEGASSPLHDEEEVSTRGSFSEQETWGQTMARAWGGGSPSPSSPPSIVDDSEDEEVCFSLFHPTSTIQAMT